MTTQAAQETTPTSAPVDAQQRALANVSVIIPTFNEELNLPHALKSVVDKAQQVFVVDSESTDRTQSIAEDFGATVVVRPWLGYAAQKNWALDNLPIETDWVFILDADESITPELWTEIEAITRILTATQGNRSETARRLGLSRPGLLKKMKRYGIE